MGGPMETGRLDQQPRNLADAVREARTAAADRADVVVDIREGQRTRLELLAEELQPVFADVPAEDDRFDFALSTGLQPRLWVDAVSHVTMAPDRRTYRFLRDTRLGRVVLAETPDLKIVADQVTRYIAERMVERQRDVQGEMVSLRPLAQSQAASPKGDLGSRSTMSFWQGLGMVLLGALVGGALTLVLAWQQLSELGLTF